MDSSKRQKLSRSNSSVQWRFFTPAGILAYLDKVRSTKSTSTYNLTVSAFRDLIKINLAESYSMKQVQSFLDKLKPIKQNSLAVTKDRVLNKTEISELLDSLRHRPKQRTLVEFLAVTGCRVSEVVKVMLKNISINGDFAVIEVLGKGNKSRKVYIKTKLFNEIKQNYSSDVYLFQREKSGVSGESTVGHISRQYVFNLLKSMHVGSKRKQPIVEKKITPHTFRHSLGTTLAKSGKPIKAISKYLGHSDTNITNKYYVHTEFEGDDLLEVMDF